MIRGMIIDLDGVILRGSSVLETAINAINKLNEHGCPFVVLSNRTDPDSAAICTLLRSHGASISRSRILLGCDAVERHLATQQSGSCMVLGSSGFRGDLINAGVPVVREATDDCRYVVVGACSDLDSHLIARAVVAIKNGADLIAVNRVGIRIRDARSHDVLLGPGFVVGGLEAVTGTTARIVGKPHERFFSLAIDLLELPAESILMVGDRLHEDIAGAEAVGCQHVLITESAKKLSSSEGLWKSTCLEDVVNCVLGL